MTDYLRIHPKDNVAVAVRSLHAGQTVDLDGLRFQLKDDIPAGHKFLLTSTRAHEHIIKYGYPIGHLTTDLQQGAWVNEHNLHTNLSGVLEYEYRPNAQSPSAKQTVEVGQFLGYRRRNGDVGIRNELWIVPTVGCVNGICQQLATQFKEKHVTAFTHNYGCSQLGDDHESTRKILRDLILHPNAGGVLVVGLGCENNQPEALRDMLGNYDQDRIRFMVTQQVDGDEVEEGVRLLSEIHEVMKHDVSEEIPLSELRIGLKCGGSDGFSGITANPLLGLFSDYLVGQGGTAVLTEVPEMFGAEQILMNRCPTRELFEQTVRLVNDFKEYFLSHGEPVGENPSPGNKAGGISTLEEKALGCTQKCGQSPVRGVLGYGERLTEKGLNLLSAPGNDLVASTALAAAGCHIVLFTTGRGTPFGTFVPTMKISTNSSLAQRKPTWIDFNAGVLLEDASWKETLDAFTQKVIAIANGEPTWNERKHYQEIAIFKRGVTL